MTVCSSLDKIPSNSLRCARTAISCYKMFFVKCLSSFHQNTAQSLWQCSFKPFSVAWSNGEYCYSPLDGTLAHRRAVCHRYTWQRLMPKETTQQWWQHTDLEPPTLRSFHRKPNRKSNVLTTYLKYLRLSSHSLISDNKHLCLRICLISRKNLSLSSDHWQRKQLKSTTETIETNTRTWSPGC